MGLPEVRAIGRLGADLRRYGGVGAAVQREQGGATRRSSLGEELEPRASQVAKQRRAEATV